MDLGLTPNARSSSSQPRSPKNCLNCWIIFTHPIQPDRIVKREGSSEFTECWESERRRITWGSLSLDDWPWSDKQTRIWQELGTAGDMPKKQGFLKCRLPTSPSWYHSLSSPWMRTERLFRSWWFRTRTTISVPYMTTKGFPGLKDNFSPMALLNVSQLAVDRRNSSMQPV